MQAFMQTSGAPLDGRFPPELFPKLAAFLRTPKIEEPQCEGCGGEVWSCVLCKEEVTVFSPPCSAPAILQAAPATKALRSDPPCSSETRFKAKPESIVEYCHCCGRATAAGLYFCGILGCGHNFAPCCMRVLGPRSLKCKCHDQEIEDAQHTKALRRPKKQKNR